MRTKRTLALIVIIALFVTLFPGYESSVMAASEHINIYITDYDLGRVTFRWDPVMYARSVKISWHTPENGLEGPVIVNQTHNYYQISGLSHDYIYDIKVEIYDDENGFGRRLAEGFLYFCPGISFYATALKQDYVDLVGGGREIGSNPKLNLRWIKPKVWNGSTFVYVDEALGYMQKRIADVYNDGREISDFGFRINISSDVQTLNSGSLQQSVLIDNDLSEYTARTSGMPDVTCKVHNSDKDGYMSFDLIGRTDENAPLPEVTEYELPNTDIFPGTVYYMNIKPIFKDTKGDNVNAVTVGVPSQMNGSPLLGAVPYTYTPIRFQLSKDAANNVFVKIFKLNQGSLDLPRLYYEIQASDDPSIVGDWDVKDTMDDSYFSYGSPYAITILTGINPSNTIHYKVVVKSDSPTDRITSQSMPYRIEEDTNRPPAPRNVKAQNPILHTRERIDPVTGELIVEKTTDIVLSWEKPSDWQEIISNTDPQKDIYMHVLLSTSQTDIELEPIPNLVAEGKVYGQFQPKYRLVKYFNLRSPNVRENGNRLEYVLNGFDLFKGEDRDGLSDETIENKDGYPEFLLPNTVYYLQMYTTKSEDHKGSTKDEQMSDKSITTSFTTLPTTEMEVPLPLNFRLTKNAIDDVSGDNYIEISLDKINIDWEYYVEENVTKHLYYDFYMSNSLDLDSFILIGTTEKPDDDILFSGLDAASGFINVRIKDFTKQELVNRFGYKIRSNDTYYFMARTRLVIEDQDDKISRFTSIIAVTTVQDVIGIPDESAKRPLAPIDFKVVDTGSSVTSASTVTFEWSRLETNEMYQIICTSDYIKPGAVKGDYESDPIYLSFISAFGGPININPDEEPPLANLEYDRNTNTYKFTIDRWIYPNRIYYFSIRTIDKSNNKESVWVSIPVTTALIEAPLSIEAINDYQLKFNWRDSASANIGDYKIYLKKHNESEFKLIRMPQYQIVKDNTNYYTTVYNLESDTLYDIKVYREKGYRVLVYDKYNLNTRNGFHQIEVEWKGVGDYGYELAIKAESDDDYTVLTNADLEYYRNVDGEINPWYMEKTFDTLSSGYYNYLARIKTIPVYVDGRITEHKELESNTRYYVKVRSVKVDVLESSNVAYSKYIGPCDTRTEFSQDDYDENERETKKKAMFLDKIDELDKSLFWRVDIGSLATEKLLLKGNRISNLILKGGSSAFVLNLTETLEADIFSVNEKTSSYEIYIPLNVIQSLKTTNTPLKIRLEGSEFTIRPGAVSLAINDYFDSFEYSFIKDIMFKVTINRGELNVQDTILGHKPVSDAVDFIVDLSAIAYSYNEIETLIYECLHDSEKGLINKKLHLLDSYDENALDALDWLEQYIELLVHELEQELSIYIYGLLGESVIEVKTIHELDQPFMMELNITDIHPYLFAYVMPHGMNQWVEIKNGVSYSKDIARLNTFKTGRYVILKEAGRDVSGLESSGFSQSTLSFLSEYNLTDLFGNTNPLYYYNNASVKDTVLIYEKLTERKTAHNVTDIKILSGLLGLDGILSTNNMAQNISRQEAACVLIELYTEKVWVDIEKYHPRRTIYINDEKDIDNKRYKRVLMAIDLGLLNLDGNKRFLPHEPISVIDLINAFQKILENTRGWY